MEYIELREICNIDMGQSPESSSYNDNKNGLPFFQGNADFGEKYPIARVWCNSPKKIANAGDILISVRAPIGALNYANEDCCIGRGLAAIKVDENKISKEFVYYLLKGKNVELNNKGTGSTFKAIGKKVLEEVLVPDINIEIQKKYVQSLEILYGIIQKRKQQLVLLNDLIKAQFVEMFGDPVENLKGWEKHKLVDICDKLTDGTHFSPESFPKGEFMYITAKNIKAEGFDLSNVTFVNADVHSEIYARCDPKYGDVLYIKDGVTTGIAIVNTLKEPFAMLSSVALLKQKRNIVLGSYLCAVLNHQHMYDLIRSNMGGAAITRLTITKLNEILIPVAPMDLQEQFATFVQQIDKSKVAIQKSLDEIQLLFDSLMQKYFG